MKKIVWRVRQRSLSPQPITENTLFYGDNLNILREYLPDESIDLIYLDPPFNSNRSYNDLFKDESGTDSEAQITAFEDTWHWNETAEESYHQLVTQAPEHIARMIGSLRDFIGTNQMMAYLIMTATRLLELHRVLKLTGSLYLSIVILRPAIISKSSLIAFLEQRILEMRLSGNALTFMRTLNGSAKSRIEFSFIRSQRISHSIAYE
jgi:DNA modification methylase